MKLKGPGRKRRGPKIVAPFVRGVKKDDCSADGKRNKFWGGKGNQ